jgi:RNA polymerase sigma-70 factor (ECF subfamily)
LTQGDNNPKVQSAEENYTSAANFHDIEDEVQKLPARQREAFLLRYWEDLDVAETATAMGCSEGSVKTHCSRAIQSLHKALTAKGIKP